MTNTSTTNPNTWTTTLPGPFSGALISGTSYYIVSLSTDVAGNSEFGPLAADIPGGDGVIVTYNVVAPTATITLPYTGLAGIESLPAISGTTTDLVAISTVQVAIQNLTSGLWMNGINFNFSVTQSTPNFIAAQGTVNNWTFNAGGALDSKMSGDTKYSLVTQATDVAGNVQSVYALNTSSFTFLMDRAAPNAPVILLPASGDSYQPANLGHVGNGTGLHGTNTDPGSHPSGISQVQMQLSYVLTGATYYWDGTQVKFSSSPVTTWNNSGTAAWNYENFSGNDIDWPVDMSHLFTLQVRGIDSATQADGAGTGNIRTSSTHNLHCRFHCADGRDHAARNEQLYEQPVVHYGNGERRFIGCAVRAAHDFIRHGRQPGVVERFDVARQRVSVIPRRFIPALGRMQVPRGRQANNISCKPW